ncbi:MAG: lipopolysaccharide biosynthesis protein [Fretibacterium sp.]|nr:lipopolysaccharide biosynthesis protein [Fretibacterium sp.]
MKERVLSRLNHFFKGSFFRNTTFYVGFAFLNRGISFLLIPFFTRSLTREAYGTYALFLTAAAICEPFVDMCFKDGITYVYYQPSRFSIRRYVSTFFYTSFFLSLLQLMALWGLTFVPLGQWRVPSFLILAPLCALAGAVSAALERTWRVRETPVPFGLFSLACVLLQLVLNIGVVIFLRWGWQGLLGTQVILACFKIFVAVTVFRRMGWLVRGVDFTHLKFGLKFGLGYLPNNLASRLDGAVGRFFLVRLHGLGMVGLYSMGQSLGSVVTLYSTSLINVYQPWLYRQFSSGERIDKRKIARATLLVFVSILIFAWLGSAVVYLFSGLILGKNFQGALPFIFWASTSQALNGMYWVASIFIVYTTKTWILSLLTLGALGQNVLFTWYFIRLSGPIGAAYAPVLVWFLSLCFSIMTGVRLWRNRSCV